VSDQRLFDIAEIFVDSDIARFATHSSAKAAARAADAAERSLLLHSVPVVFGWKAQSTGGSRTDVALKAVGRGVALNVTAEVHEDGTSFGSTSADHAH